MESFLTKFASTYGFENVKLKFASGSEKGDNFVGIVSKLAISGDINSVPSKLCVVVKSAPTIKETRDVMPTRKLFLREIFAYTDVFPVLDNLQEKIPKDDQFRFVKCFTVNKEDMNELLVMEDMMLQSYRLHKPRLETLDFDHLTTALTALAKFHALSFVLQERNPDLYQKFAAQATNELYIPEYDVVKDYTDKSAERAIKILPKSLESFVKNTFDNIVNLLKPQKYSVLCHGDYWKNNIVFKYQNGKPVSASPLDYQILRHASPVTDITYLLFCCSTQQLRRQHFETLILGYHEELGSQLRRFSLDVENVFPRAAFMDELKRAGSFGLCSAICALMFMTCTEEEIPNPVEAIQGTVAAEKEDGASFKSYSERICGVAEDCVQYGYVQ